MKRILLNLLSRKTWHRINAGIVTILILTGFYLRQYSIAALKPHDPVLVWHKYLGFVMILSTVAWHLNTLWSKNPLRRYGIVKKDLKSLPVQARYRLFLIFSGAIMFLFLPVLGVTGLLFLDIPPARRYLISENLLGPIGAVHVGFSYILVLFFIVHLYLATLNLSGRRSRR